MAAGLMLAALVIPCGVAFAQAQPDPVQQAVPPAAEPATPSAAISPEPPADSGNRVDPGDPNVTPERQAFDHLLVDAAVLRNDYEKSKRSRSRSRPSLSAFRSLELQLQAVVDADPSNSQAQDMLNAMRQVQGEILQPSIVVAAGASRQLFADELSQQLGSQGIKVTSAGRGNTVLMLASPTMTRELALQLNISAKIFERARMLQFEQVIFRGRRGRWTYDAQRDRFR